MSYNSQLYLIDFSLKFSVKCEKISEFLNDIFYILSPTTYKQFHAKAHTVSSDTHTHGSSLYCMIMNETPNNFYFFIFYYELTIEI